MSVSGKPEQQASVVPIVKSFVGVQPLSVLRTRRLGLGSVYQQTTGELGFVFVTELVRTQTQQSLTGYGSAGSCAAVSQQRACQM